MQKIYNDESNIDEHMGNVVQDSPTPLDSIYSLSDQQFKSISYVVGMLIFFIVVPMVIKVAWNHVMPRIFGKCDESEFTPNTCLELEYTHSLSLLILMVILFK